MTPPTSDPTPEDTMPALPRRRRLGRVFWLLFLLPLLLLGGSGWWLTATPAGFATLWQWAGQLSGGQLKVGRVQGTLWQGFTLQRLHWQTPDSQLALSQLVLDWDAQALWQRQLHIRSLQLGPVSWRSRPNPQPKPLQAPSDLSLPLTLRVDALRVASLSLPDSQLQLGPLQASYRYDSGRHQLQLTQLDTPWGRLQSEFALGDAAPFALHGSSRFQGDIDGLATRGQLAYSGSLLFPQLRGEVSAKGLLLALQGKLAPFDVTPLRRLRQLDLRVGGVNPQALQPQWPQASLALALQLTPQNADTIQGGISVVNNQPGTLAAKRLPLSLAWGEFRIQRDTLYLPGLQALLADGQLSLKGQASADKLALQLGLDRLASQALDPALPAHRVSGSVALGGSPRQPDMLVKLASGQLALDSRVALRDAPRRLLLDDLLLRTGAGRFQGKGQFGLDSQQLGFDGRFERFDPAVLDPRLPRGNVNGQLQARASLGAKPQGDVGLRFTASQLGGEALGGQLALAWQPQRVSAVNANLTLGRNRLQAQGAYGVAGDVLKLQLAAPDLSPLGAAFAGELNAQLALAGTPARPDISAQLQANRLALPGGVQVASLNADGRSGITPDSPFRLNLQGRGLQAGGQRLDEISLLTSGTRQAHQLNLALRGELQAKPQTLNLALQGGLDSEQMRWRGTLASLQAGGALPLRLEAPVALQLAADSVQLAPSRWQALGTGWQLGDTAWQQASGWRSQGQVRSLALDALAPWWTPPLQQNLVLAAQWSLAGQHGLPQGSLSLQRISGDLMLPAQGAHPAEPVGLSRAQLQLGLGDAAPFSLQLDTRFGRVSGDGTLNLPAAAPLDTATISGRLQASVPALSVLQSRMPAGTELDGSLAANLTLNGPLLAPQLGGTLSGQKLRFVERRNGIRLEQGVLAARLLGRSLQIDTLQFGKDGEIGANGQLALDGDIPLAAVTLTLKRFAVLDRPGRRLLVSGSSRITLEQGRAMVRGAFSVDHGRFDLPRLGGPKLSDDVFVAGRVYDEGGKALPLGLDITVTLSDDVRFAGNGLDAWLGGSVRLLAEPGGQLQARGQIRVDKGRFKAYGQDLDINRGVVSFTGPLDNPVLDIRAKRRFSQVGAGVEISGSVLNPAIKLVADEAMSEKDKLSWLVLNRAATSDERDSDIAGASAGGLLAGMVNDKIGLFDDVGVVSRAESTSASGTVNPAEQVVMLGKQLTRELYVGYEYGLRSAEQAIRINYQLSQKLSLVGRAGREASSELRYTLRFD
ncbi:MAG: translocation/assembly module TamB domain-containing protein [Vogesella sp.]|uniref:translocation/assembly module TamB domain-containing protein n=1 Tax=Vogesella sp. TaxID=1904252 RepID=UPI00391B3E30